MTNAAWGQLGLLALIWGGSFLSVRVALDEVGPLWIVGHRAVWAALALWPVALLARRPLPRGLGVWAALLVMGALNNAIPFGLLAWGQQHVETGLVAILNASTAIFGVLFAALFFADERLSLRKATGVACGFAGVVTVIGPAALSGFDLGAMGQVAVIGATISYALAGVWARKALTGLPPLTASAGMTTGAALIMLPLAWGFEGAPDLTLSAPVWSGLAYVSLGSTALAYILYYRVIAVAGSGNVLLVTLMVAPVAILLGVVVLGEALPARAFAGFGLLAAGLVVIDGRLLRRRRRLAQRF
ncbi:DMT family transporter [Limimaricola pyoseonensis]|nr:DMT family transporter [Limimaricola pyoseonensis]